MRDKQSTSSSEIDALAERVATARGRLPLQDDTALVDVLSDAEIEAERQLAEWVRAQRRGQRKRAVEDELTAEKRGRRTVSAIQRADDADARWHRRALAARRRVSNQDARLAQLYRRAEWSSRALIGVVVLGMVWAGVNVQHNLVPSGNMADPLYWLSYGIEAMISIPIITIMVAATTAARWGRELDRGKVVFFEVALLGTTVALNAGPHLAAGSFGQAAEYAIAPVMVGVVIWLHAWVSARYALLIDSVPIADDEPDVPTRHRVTTERGAPITTFHPDEATDRRELLAARGFDPLLEKADVRFPVGMADPGTPHMAQSVMRDFSTRPAEADPLARLDRMETLVYHAQSTTRSSNGRAPQPTPAVTAHHYPGDSTAAHLSDSNHAQSPSTDNLAAQRISGDAMVDTTLIAPTHTAPPTPASQAHNTPAASATRTMSAAPAAATVSTPAAHAAPATPTDVEFAAPAAPAVTTLDAPATTAVPAPPVAPTLGTPAVPTMSAAQSHTAPTDATSAAHAIAASPNGGMRTVPTVPAAPALDATAAATAPVMPTPGTFTVPTTSAAAEPDVPAASIPGAYAAAGRDAPNGPAAHDMSAGTPVHAAATTTGMPYTEVPAAEGTSTPGTAPTATAATSEAAHATPATAATPATSATSVTAQTHPISATPTSGASPSTSTTPATPVTAATPAAAPGTSTTATSATLATIPTHPGSASATPGTTPSTSTTPATSATAATLATAPTPASTGTAGNTGNANTARTAANTEPSIEPGMRGGAESQLRMDFDTTTTPPEPATTGRRTRSTTPSRTGSTALPAERAAHAGFKTATRATEHPATGRTAVSDLHSETTTTPPSTTQTGSRRADLGATATSSTHLEATTDLGTPRTDEHSEQSADAESSQPKHTADGRTTSEVISDVVQSLSAQELFTENPVLGSDDDDVEVWSVARAIAGRGLSVIPVEQLAEILMLADQSLTPTSISAEVGLSRSAIAQVLDFARRVRRPYAVSG